MGPELNFGRPSCFSSFFVAVVSVLAFVVVFVFVVVLVGVFVGPDGG